MTGVQTCALPICFPVTICSCHIVQKSGRILKGKLKMYMFQIFATILSLVGAVLSVIKNKWCFIVWACASVLWVLWSISTGENVFGFVLTQVCFFTINIAGFKAWSRSDKCAMGSN